jgi:hypothetical protein
MAPAVTGVFVGVPLSGDLAAAIAPPVIRDRSGGCRLPAVWQASRGLALAACGQGPGCWLRKARMATGNAISRAAVQDQDRSAPVPQHLLGVLGDA